MCRMDRIDPTLPPRFLDYIHAHRYFETDDAAWEWFENLPEDKQDTHLNRADAWYTKDD